MSQMKLISLNIEGSKHLPRVADFLDSEKADVVCLMEVIEEDIESVLHDYPYRIFKPNFLDEDEHKYGVAIGSKTMWESEDSTYCDGREDSYLTYGGQGITHRPAVIAVVVDRYQIVALHFTWTPDGKMSLEQERDLNRLFEWMGERQGVICGDFNIPRGNELYQKLLTKYRDNVPVEVESTLDPILHYANHKIAGSLKLVVDYMWSTPEYRVENVRVVSGVSDHCAVVCSVEKT